MPKLKCRKLFLSFGMHQNASFFYLCSNQSKQEIMKHFELPKEFIIISTLHFQIWTLLLLAFLPFSCSKTGISTSENLERDVLDFSYHPNLEQNVFFDQGAWFGFALAPENEIGFSGPYILSDSNGYWLSPHLIDFSFFKDDINIGAVLKKESWSMPGKLVQNLSDQNLNIKLELIFRDKNTVLISCSILNKTKEDIEIDAVCNINGKGPLGEEEIMIDLNNACIKITAENYKQAENGISLIVPKKKSVGFYISVQHLFKNEMPLVAFDFLGAESDFKENKKRWDNYLSILDGLSDTKKIAGIKAIQTLIGNWRSAAGELKHDGLFPSYAYGGFHGFWAWDSWKHAAALAHFEPELAKNQVRAMFDFQDKNGMIADCIFRDTLIEKHNWRDTKPPLSAWAVMQIFNQTKDSAFVQELFPKLLKYHLWWYENRDHNKNRLCEYGSTDGTRIAAAWESGMDNAVRFDSAKLTKNNAQAWSLTQESVDLNAYLFAEKNYLAEMASILEKDELEKQFHAEAELLKTQIQQGFFDERSGYFYDVKTSDTSLIEVIGPEAWITLWANAATGKQAESLVKIITDSLHFNSYLPFPTLSVSHPEFNPKRGYWRGPVWIDQAYFVLKGMRNYGFLSEAENMQNKLFSHAEGLMLKGPGIYENYEPGSGKGLNARNFSWSAAHFLLLLMEEKNGE
jgi:glucosidase